MYKALGSIPNTTKKKGGVRQWLYTKSGEKQRWEEKGMVDKPLAPALWKERQAVLQEFQASPVDTVSFRSTRTTKWRLSPQNKYINSRIEADWFSASLGTSTLNSILDIPVCTPTRMNNPFLSACVVILLILAIRVELRWNIQVVLICIFFHSSTCSHPIWPAPRLKILSFLQCVFLASLSKFRSPHGCRIMSG